MSTAAPRRVAIVTGSSRGIGLAIALTLADDGFDVVINCISSPSGRIDDAVQAVKAKGRRSIGIVADVSSEDDVKMLIDKTVLEFGHLDVMVANAGIIILKSLVDTSVEEYDRVMRVNASGVMMCFKYAAAQMIKQGKGGNLVAAASTFGKRGVPSTSAYCMSKFAIRGLVQSLAQELRNHGIRVNAYAPGSTETDMIKFVEQSDPNNLTGQPAVLVKSENVASLVSYLVNPESAFINGQTIIINDGQNLFD